MPREKDEQEAIFRECVAGRRLREIARSHNMTLPEVHRVLDVVAERTFTAARRRLIRMLQGASLGARRRLDSLVLSRSRQTNDPL